MAFQDITQKLADYIEYRLDEGDQTAAISPHVMDGLREPPERTRPTTPPSPSPPQTDTPQSDDALARIASEVAGCTNCDLHADRRNTVPGQGSPHPDILFIGEGPGQEEDRQGLAFVGKAGQLLTKMIEAMGYRREEVFIANIVKCRPPGNRAPLPDEMETCMPYLKAQIAALKPKVIVALGGTALKGLIDPGLGITRARGIWRAFEGIDVMPTFHPAYLLRNPSAKRETWDDLKAVLAHLGRKPPPVKKRR